MNEADTPANRLRGIAMMVVATAVFSAADAIAKDLTQTHSVAIVLWTRYSVHLAIVFAMPGAWNIPALIATKRLDLQVLRAFLQAISAPMFFVAVSFMPLAEITSITFVGPIVLTALSVPLLGEKVGPRRWAAVVVGFLGVAIVMQPGLQAFGTGALLPLGSALAFAVLQVATRILNRTDRAVTTLFYTAGLGWLATSIVVPFYWQTPMAGGWLMLGLMGLVSGLGHIVMIRAFHVAPASLLAPFAYSQLIWATLLGWLFFGDLPTGWTILGAGVIVGSGIYISYREGRARGAGR